MTSNQNGADAGLPGAAGGAKIEAALVSTLSAALFRRQSPYMAENFARTIATDPDAKTAGELHCASTSERRACAKIAAAAGYVSTARSAASASNAVAAAFASTVG
jgi:hypothetical protein